MDRAFESGAIGVAPTVPAVPSVGFPTGGNPVGGVPATKPGAHWFHMVTEELRALIVAGGLTPSPSVVDQVLQALPAALASRPEMARSLVANGYQRLPGGLIIQWGTLSVASGSSATVTLPISMPTGIAQVAFGPQSTANSTTPIAAAWQSINQSSFTLRNISTVTASISWIALGN